MGVIYHIEPLDEEMAALLEEMGSPVPDADRPSRNPTPAELRQACSALEGFETEFNVQGKSVWQAIIEGQTKRNRNHGTVLNVEEFQGAEDEPLSIWFEKGAPTLILEIVKRLSKPCGPLVVIPDTGDPPVAVHPAASVKELADQWEHSGDPDP